MSKKTLLQQLREMVAQDEAEPVGEELDQNTQPAPAESVEQQPSDVDVVDIDPNCWRGNYDDLYEPDGPTPGYVAFTTSAPDLDPEQARRKQLSADLLELTLEDERRFEEREEQQRLDELAENFERSLNDRED